MPSAGRFPQIAIRCRLRDVTVAGAAKRCFNVGMKGELDRMSDFKRLRVWRKSHALALNAQRLAGGLRGPHRIALRGQITRAALSIPTNIVEGRGQISSREFARFLRIALNSSTELEYHLIFARDSRAIDDKAFVAMLDQVLAVRMMLHGLLKRLAADADPSRHS